MKNTENIIQAIAVTADCVVIRRTQPLTLDTTYTLPEDLQYYLQTYLSIILFETAEYPIRIVGGEEFAWANPVIMGEDAQDDISHHWFVIGIGSSSQYLTIDLAPERLGRCYDSFSDRHGVAGEQPVIAHSFTALLQSLLNNKGKRYYWLEDGFQSLGDAYDEQML